MAKVSVIIPVYNVESYLRQCLDSVANQTLRDIEVVCVDDGSTDGSAAVVAEYAAKDPRFKVVSRAHSNAGAARNAGMAVATGEWLFFFDADDFAGAEMLSRMTTCDGAGAADVVVAGHRTLEGGKITAERLPRRFLEGHDEEGGACRPWLFVDAGAMPWNKLFRRSFVHDRGLAFQEIPRHNDLRFVCCALAAAGNVAVSNTCGYVYRRGRNGGITESASEQGAFLFADVLQSLRRELEERGLSAKAMQAYGNLALAHCYYHLLGEFDAVSFAELYAALHGHLLADLGLDETDRYTFVNRKHLEYLKATLADESPLSLWMILLKERYSSWKELCLRNEKISGLQKKASESEGEVARLRAANELSERRMESLARDVSERDHSIEALNRHVESQQGLLDAANHKVSDFKAQLRIAKDANVELSRRLEAIRRSRSYRLGRLLTCPFRWLFDIICAVKNKRGRRRFS
jgi:glycosyltransferase involved in cell wall biosynthesis